MTQGNSELIVYQFVIKECDEGSRWTSRWKRRAGQVCGEGLPCPLWVQYLPSTSKCLPTWKPSQLGSLGIFMEASSLGHDHLHTPFLTPHLFLEIGWWGWKFQASHHGVDFLEISLIQEPPRSPLRVPSLEQKCPQCSYHLGIYKELTILIQERGQRPNIYLW